MYNPNKYLVMDDARARACAPGISWNSRVILAKLNCRPVAHTMEQLIFNLQHQLATWRILVAQPLRVGAEARADPRCEAD